jgi:hypothetical protein
MVSGASDDVGEDTFLGDDTECTIAAIVEHVVDNKIGLQIFVTGYVYIYIYFILKNSTLIR